MKKKLGSPQPKKNSRGMRLWHWSNAVVLTGSLLTVLVASTLYDDDNLSPVLTSEFAKTGVHLTDDQSGTVARVLSDRTWTIHIYLGYILAALLLFRIIYEFFRSPEKRFITSLTASFRIYRSMERRRNESMKSVFVKLLYACFYFLLFVMVITGLHLAFRLKPFSDIVREIHSYTMYLILAFIVLHVVGIFWSERKESPGIISDMVNGGNIRSKDKGDE